MLQTVQTIAALYLPSLNADIIDKGVAQGDTGYILRTGGDDAGRHAACRSSARIAAVYFGAQDRDGLRPRRARRGSSTGSPTSPAREVGQFGAPSLITRTTNDVQQVQMLVLMTCTMLVAAPITCVGGVIMALREDVGLSLAARRRACPCWPSRSARSSAGWCRSSG